MRGSNLGAEKARARYLCFLNSDAIVEAGWLDPLVEVLDEDPTAGAAIPMFLNPNGTIQEAGSVIDSVGWPHAFGAGDSPKEFAHRFRREIDYGSAACLLIARQTFWDTGGFDPAYGVGYFEDVDLSFKLKDRGLRTMYEPRSRVVHESTRLRHLRAGPRAHGGKPGDLLPPLEREALAASQPRRPADELAAPGCRA